MKFTNEERARIRAWLEKDPKSEDTSKTLVLDREGGPVTLGRVTQYFGGTDWKVRIAYEMSTNYPVLMSSPIPGDQDSKKQAKTKYPMVPKIPTPEVTPKKPVGNKSVFEKAVDWEMKQIKQGLTMQKANYILKDMYPAAWDWGSPKSKANGLPSGVYKKAVKGTKALYGTTDTLYVTPGQTFAGSFYHNELEFRAVPKGYVWVELMDLWILVKK